MSESARLEFLVEPFVIDSPGRHVKAAVSVVDDAGLDPDMGPFATTATGNLEAVIGVIGEMVRAGFANGAVSVQLRIDTADGERIAGLHDALDRIVAVVERELGSSMVDMSRSQKQEAVARLDAHGAFLLRGSVEAIAAMMGVSKVTLYAYLNAVGTE